MLELPSMSLALRNPEQALVTDLLFDTSSSMLTNGAAEQAMSGLNQFVADILADPILAHSVELGVVAFGRTTTTERLVKFGPMRDFRPPKLNFAGATPLCELYMRSVAEVTQRQRMLREDRDQDIRQAWGFLFTDGGASDSHLLPNTQRVRDEATRNNIAMFLIGVGEGEAVNMEFLRQLAQPKRRPLRLPEVADFAKFFRWLHVSLRRKSMSQPDEEFELPDPINGDDEAPGWAAKG